jgi:preprotein translocase subunit SecE
MIIFKRILLVLLSPVFTMLLFVTALDVGFVRTATHPQTVKDLVAKSGIYDSIVPNLLQQNDKIPTPLGDISTADPQIKSAITSAIPAKTVEQQANTAIDNIYTWLDGKTAQPMFNVGLADQKNQFSDSVSSVIEQRLQNLPACSNAQSLAIARSGSFDALSATCLPKGISPFAAAQSVKLALQNSDYLSKANISVADIKDSTGQSVFNTKLKDAPKRYQEFKKTPFILAILTILTGAGVVLLSANWRKGLRHVGITVLLAGLFMLIFAWGLNKGINENLPKLNIDNAVLEQSVNNLVKQVTHQIISNYKFFGWLYAGLGIIITAAGFYLIRRDTAKPALDTNQSTPSSAAQRSKPPTESKR